MILNEDQPKSLSKILKKIINKEINKALDSQKGGSSSNKYSNQSNELKYDSNQNQRLSQSVFVVPQESTKIIDEGELEREIL